MSKAATMAASPEAFEIRDEEQILAEIKGAILPVSDVRGGSK